MDEVGFTPAVARKWPHLTGQRLDGFDSAGQSSMIYGPSVPVKSLNP